MLFDAQAFASISLTHVDIVSFRLSLFSISGKMSNFHAGKLTVKFGKKSEFFQNHEFSIEISEATVRDFDLNPGACES